eukprot:sb/3477305/
MIRVHYRKTQNNDSSQVILYTSSSADCEADISLSLSLSPPYLSVSLCLSLSLSVSLCLSLPSLLQKRKTEKHWKDKIFLFLTQPRSSLYLIRNQRLYDRNSLASANPFI